jgi:LacI family transcriptional regulator
VRAHHGERGATDGGILESLPDDVDSGAPDAATTTNGADGAARRGSGPALRDVARRAGVAVSSASRALSDHASVSPELRERVMRAAAELGYEPNLLAQGLRRGATSSVGFVMRDISSPLFSEIALGAEVALRERGYSMLLTNSEGRPELDLAHVRLLRQRRVDGLLLSLADEGHEPTLAELERLRLPVVLIDREVPHPSGLSAVLCDHGAGVRAAAEQLVGRGHRTLGLVGGPLSLRPGRECAHALERFCAGRAGTRAVVEPGAFSEQHGFEATARMLAAPSPPTALITGSHQILPGVLRAFDEAGDAADGIDLVAFDDTPLLPWVARPLGVVSREGLEIGRVGARLLLDLLRGGEPRTVVVPTVYRSPVRRAPAQ